MEQTDSTISRPATQNNTRATSPRSTRAAQQYLKPTFEAAAAQCPHEGLANNIARTFALDLVDYPAIREATEEHVVRLSNALVDDLNERAIQMHLQRIVDAFVSSAHSAGTFYQTKVTEARDLTSRLANEARDEDREGVYGFESKPARARDFAAKMGLQAYALLSAAEGAVHAYAHVTGEDWKPYQPAVANPRTAGRQAAHAEIDAFNT